MSQILLLCVHNIYLSSSITFVKDCTNHAGSQTRPLPPQLLTCYLTHETNTPSELAQQACVLVHVVGELLFECSWLGEQRKVGRYLPSAKCTYAEI
jgi:hypothetical protein